MDVDLSDLLEPEIATDYPRNMLPNLPQSRLTFEQADQAVDASRDFVSPLPRPDSIQPTNNDGKQNQVGAVITKIEDIFESIADCMLEGKRELTIKLKTGRSRTNQEGNRGDDNDNSRGIKRSSTTSITFPSKSPREAWKFTVLIRILELSHEALVTGVVTTKRDIYYKDPELFVKQEVVDRYVDDVAFTLGVERDSLNVVAAAKALVAGAFSIIRTDQSIVDYSVENQGTLIPKAREIRDLNVPDVRWIIVIEKDATFQTLTTNPYWQYSLAGKGIIITAKGYPDVQTRQFLHLFWTRFPYIPIFALVDFDPDGLGIMSTYKHGSMALAHESLNLIVPSVQWLGVRSSDFLATGLDVQGLLKLTARDRRIARKMLEKEMFGEEGQETEWRRELQVMLMTNVKAEIQILGNSKSLGIWLDNKLVNGA